MLKKIITTVSILGAFVIGSIVASIFHFGSPLIDIELINHAEKDRVAVN